MADVSCRVVLLATVLTSIAVATTKCAAAPKAFFFRTRYVQTNPAPLAGDPLGRSLAQIWNAALNTPLEGVLVYDPDAFQEATNYVTLDTFVRGVQRQYYFPSPSAAGPPQLAAGPTGLSYVTSNGKTFRRALGAPGGPSVSPTLFKVANNAFQPYGPPEQLPPGFQDASDYVDILVIRDSLTLDPKNGPFVRPFDLSLTDLFSGGSLPGSKANLLSGAATDGSNSVIPASIGQNQGFAPPPRSWWIVGGDLNTAESRSSAAVPQTGLWEMPLGDINLDGQATAADLQLLLANYGRAAGTFAINAALNDPHTEPEDWLGQAIWTHGDFNLDGLVDHLDYELLLANFIPGDVNLDGKVDIFDVATVSNHWGAVDSPVGDADRNGTLDVDIFDIAAVSANWGATSAGAANVPEPETAVPLACAALALGFRRAVRRVRLSA